MTEVTLKVMPKPESERTLVLAGLDDVTSNRAMTAALGSPYDVSGASHLPGSVFGTATGALARLGAGGRAVTLLRLEGIAASVADRAGSLGKVLATFGAVETLQDDASAAVWAAVRDVNPFAAGGARGLWPVWRIVCPPAAGGALGQELARGSEGEVIYDWGGGLIWAAVPPRPDTLAGPIRQRVEAAGGHATLIRAPEEVRRNVEVFHPQAAGVAALGQRVRHSFDPKIILNRGRMARTSAT
jgi:glycolate oxidase FAD binding subunit